MPGKRVVETTINGLDSYCVPVRNLSGKPIARTDHGHRTVIWKAGFVEVTRSRKPQTETVTRLRSTVMFATLSPPDRGVPQILIDQSQTEYLLPLPLDRQRFAEIAKRVIFGLV